MKGVVICYITYKLIYYSDQQYSIAKCDTQHSTIKWICSNIRSKDAVLMIWKDVKMVFRNSQERSNYETILFSLQPHYQLVKFQHKQERSKNMKILVACEESQRVCIELRARGHEAYSCDIESCSGGHPEWHIKGDVLPLLNGNCEFRCELSEHYRHINKWDMILAFPPCTHLAVSGARHFQQKRYDGRQAQGIELFGEILNADCDKIAVENPVNIISGDYIINYFPELCKRYGLPKQPSQRIQPFEYGDPSKKTTCLWLKNLPLLKPTKIVEPELIQYTCADGRKVTFSKDYIVKSNKDRGKIRSKTYPGIAKAMAEQWTQNLNEG